LAVEEDLCRGVAVLQRELGPGILKQIALQDVDHPPRVTDDQPIVERRDTELVSWIPRPVPRIPHHGRAQGFHVPWRDVDHELLYVSAGHGLQRPAYRPDMPAVNELRRGLDDREELPDEFVEAVVLDQASDDL